MTSLDRFMQIENDSIFIIGHSSAIVRIDGKLILLDPVWETKPYGNYWTFFPEQINCENIVKQFDACIVSHIHADHFCPDILSKLKCPTTIMNSRPNLEKAMTGNNLFWPRQPHQWTGLVKGVDCYFVPHPHNSVDSAVFIRSKKFCVYFGNDCFLDDATLEKIKHNVGRVDVALLNYSFVHYYPHLLDGIEETERFSEIKRLNKQCLDQARRFIGVIQPKDTIPIGNSLYYAESFNHPLNRYLAKPQDISEKVIPILAGDIFLNDGTTMEHPKSILFPSVEFSPLDFENTVTTKQLLRLQEKVSKIPKSIPNHKIIINGITIDTESKKVFCSDDVFERPYTKFRVNKLEFEAWLNEELTFEQVLGTRRFRYERSPNVYNLEVCEWYSLYL